VLQTAGDLSTQGLGDLDCESPNTARGTDDENLLLGFHLGAVPHTLQRGDPRDGDRRRLLKG